MWLLLCHLFLWKPSPLAAKVAALEEAVEELLGQLEAFCGLTEAIRSDTSEILEETIPLIKDKVLEMNHVYAKIDKLEAFVKMVAHHVSFLEEQVLEAEKSHGTFLNAVCKLFQCATIPSFKNSRPPSVAHSYDLPKLYRTEDYFPMNYVGTKYPNH
ncbi:breast carcinoma-amplified sequence 4 [Aythya fuligula]|uniref:Breast carcinoma-amplified sequence 4 n=1 Tax=Aythya fuligula TaxID=219594 RepID=A0A6J3DXW1_AYTFU|nr:breast carcinoma-amplified sequence 4 [Aythya fuligula]|eukprot:XP_027329098.1 breast carcinoma-amplified sequence 4 [Anas platyrhynchos]